DQGRQAGVPGFLQGDRDAGPRAEGRDPGRGVEEGRGRLGQAHRAGPLVPFALGLTLAALVAAAAESPAPGGGFRFVDAAARLGLGRVILSGRPGKDHLLDSAGTGGAFLDFDRDGRLDVYLVNAWRLEGA